MKILTIIGARPQFIKAATVSRSLKKYPEITEVIIHTGQHFDPNMSDVFFNELDIPKPDYNLGIGGGTHGAQTGKMLQGVEEILLMEKPDWVLVYGDTNSTLAGALAAAKLHIPVAHVEAGLRSFNKNMPEEINRILTDHISSILFTPTLSAISNLKKEGVEDQRVVTVGDVMYDAALYYGEKAEKQSTILKRLELTNSNFILATIHRAENTNDLDRLTLIFNSLEQISKELKVVLPLHPRTRDSLKQINWNTYDSSITFIDPVGYLDMVMLEKNAQLIITDSGGVQKEAFFHKVPCLTLRNETEWVELIDMGVNELVVELEELRAMVLRKIDESSNLFDHGDAIYGSGKASDLIASSLVGL